MRAYNISVCILWSQTGVVIQLLLYHFLMLISFVFAKCSRRALKRMNHGKRGEPKSGCKNEFCFLNKFELY